MRGKPVPKDERTEPTRVDVTIDPKAHKIDRRGCITQDNIVGMRRVFNVGKHNAGRMAELLVDHGQAVITDLHAPGEAPARFRVSSIEPRDVDDALIDLLASAPAH